MSEKSKLKDLETNSQNESLKFTFTKDTSAIDRKIAISSSALKKRLMSVQQILQEINGRFEEIEEVISSEFRTIDQQEDPKERSVFDEELMRRLAEITMHETDQEKKSTALQYMQNIYDSLHKMNKAMVEFKNHRTRCEMKFLHSIFNGKLDHIKTEIRCILQCNPFNPSNIGGMARSIPENLYIPAQDLPGIGEKRVGSLIKCIRSHYVKYKETRNSNYKRIQNWLYVMQVAQELL